MVNSKKNQGKVAVNDNSTDYGTSKVNDMKQVSEDTVEISGEGAARAASEAASATEAQSQPPEGGRGQDAGDVERLRQELKETKERLLRQIAEFQNYRRRTEQEKNQWIQAGKTMVIQQMLELMDDFTRSIEAANQLESQHEELPPVYKLLKDGVVMVYEKFQNELSRLGVEPIEAVGQPFNEAEHEALMQQPAPDDGEAGIVLDEIQKGYRLGDRVLRHSKVIVSS